MPRRRLSATLTGIVIRGFKSFRDEVDLELRPLTLLAGANSSGKSSAVQPLLLLKQTLEAGYDPGPLLLNGQNVRFMSMHQLLWHGKTFQGRAAGFTIGLRQQHGVISSATLAFRSRKEGGVDLEYLRVEQRDGRALEIRAGMSHDALKKLVGENAGFLRESPANLTLSVARNRCSFELVGERVVPVAPAANGAKRLRYTTGVADPFSAFDPLVRSMIHLPGLRGTPERTYPVADIGGHFPGVFQDYVASVIATWKRSKDENLEKLGRHLSTLGMTWKVDSQRLDDTRVELRVGRLESSQRGGAKDLVNIADVGFGVSQVLPVVVALLAANPGQIVYIEQPEIHLHPRAQVALAALLIDAAKRGVIVLAETHSHLVVRAVQRCVARGEVPPERVQLHWFTRDADGVTRTDAAGLDRHGMYGGWPADFADVELDVERSFLDASLRPTA